MICPNCGKDVKAKKILPPPEIAGDGSAAGNVNYEINCPFCGYHGFFDIEFGWKENF